MMAGNVRRCGITIGVAFLFSFAASDAEAQFTKPNLEPVTADDCQVIAKILNAKLLNAKTTNALSFASFGATCDWMQLGLNARTTTATEGWRAFFRKPNYDVGHKMATVSYTDSYNDTNGMYGSHEFRCDLQKQGERWQITRCIADVIAN
jgi:hypothetical protein